MEIVSEARCFEGRQLVLKHDSESTGCEMRCALFLPPQAERRAVPLLLFLSGLTCTWENFTTKACAQRACAQHGLALLAADTSPRGAGVADDEGYDLGQGASFYVDATQPPWDKHFQMRSYIEKDLLATIDEGGQGFRIDMQRLGICGHSMGGHGALTIALRSPQRFRSLSAFAPIVAPRQCPWGRKAFTAYLGAETDAWRDYDACDLLEARGWSAKILVDQGDQDSFLQEQLKPQLLEEVCRRKGVDLTLRMQKGYDHSYYFIASFVSDHIAFHARQLEL